MRVNLYLAALLVLSGLWAGILYLGSVKDAHAEQEKAVKWEFKTVHFSGVGTDAYDKQLNKLAADGWEYVGLVATPYRGQASGCGGMVAFKRPTK
jgi:hypothetical protein